MMTKTVTEAPLEAGLPFYRSCVGWPRNEVDDLNAMIGRSLSISRTTFLKHVRRSDLCRLEDQLGYVRHHRAGLTMAGDWHVAYSRSKLHGKTVYYFTHSAIEYVFHEPD